MWDCDDEDDCAEGSGEGSNEDSNTITGKYIVLQNICWIILYKKLHCPESV